MKNVLYLVLLSFVTAAPAVFAQMAPTPSARLSTLAPQNTAGSTLRGRVYYEDSGRPVRRASVVLVSQAGPGGEFSGLTDENGNLTITGMRAGKYWAVINAPGVASPMAFMDLKSGPDELMDEDLPGFTPILVDGVSDLQVDIPARRGGAIGGRVSYSNGDAAIGVKVEILRKVDDEYRLTVPNLSAMGAMFLGGLQTDDRGMYRLPGLPAGDYIVRITEAVKHSPQGIGAHDDAGMLFGGSSKSLVTVFFENALQKDKATPVILQMGQELSDINIVIPDRSLHVLEGKVVAAKDKLPVRNAQVSLRPEDEMDIRGLGPSSALTTQTDDDGKWRFTELPKGRYTVSVESLAAVLDQKEQAYGVVPAISSSNTNMIANAANAVAHAVSNGDLDLDLGAVVSRISNRTTAKAPPMFAKAIKEFIIEDKDVAEQVIELSLGATVMGTIAMDDGSALPGSISFIAIDTKGEQVGSGHAYVEGYEGSGTRPTKEDFRLDGVSAGKVLIAIKPVAEDVYVKSAASNQLDLLKGPVELKENDTFANIRVILSRDSGTLKLTVIDQQKRAVPRAQVIVAPANLEKARSGTFDQIVRMDENGELNLNLAPGEYIVINSEKSFLAKQDRSAWFAAQIKKGTIKIEARKTHKHTVIKDKVSSKD
jgi:hypothetical protein